MTILAIVLALLAAVIAVFAFVDRRQLEADVATLQAKVDAWEDATSAKVRNAVNALKSDFGMRVQSLESRATSLEKKTQASVQGAVNKAKAQVQGAVKSVKKRL